MALPILCKRLTTSNSHIVIPAKAGVRYRVYDWWVGFSTTGNIFFFFGDNFTSGFCFAAARMSSTSIAWTPKLIATAAGIGYNFAHHADLWVSDYNQNVGVHVDAAGTITDGSFIRYVEEEAP